ncbi:hypothetical protein GX48_04944 [Paracoccidioides brasiliensis]|nr:hypothetical protein GX48_04944 [Paracoccidioides brasiliensis]
MELFGATSIGKYGAEGSLATFREYPDDQAPWTCWKEGKIRTGRVTLKELARSTGIKDMSSRWSRDGEPNWVRNTHPTQVCLAQMMSGSPHPGFQSSIAKRPRDGVGDKKQWKEELIIECH